MDGRSGKRFVFSTKAETLERLQPLLRLATVPDFCYFAVSDWTADPDAVIRTLQSRFGSEALAVRSSAMAEDSEVSAMPGVFRSVLGVCCDDADALNNAIDRVVASYEDNGKEALDNQVLIQCLVQDISMSGVVFTHEMKTGSPYYVINYDDQSGRTDTVTSGGADSNRTLMVFRESVDDLVSERFRALLHAVQEVESVTGCDFLDVEFAVDRELCVHLLQARRITTRPNWNRGISLRIRDCIRRTRRFVSERSRPRVGWHGNRSIFAQMADWNPAEMLGSTPRPLALSLYRRLITDSAWRVARRRMGYAEPKGAALMVSLGGQPYIDTRLSFHSYLPAGLHPEIGEKLVNAWLDRLTEHAELHDKVEFEIAITALAFDFEQSVREQLPDALNPAELTEFREALRELTRELLSGRTASIAENLEAVERLSVERARLSSAYEDPDPCAIASLLEDCIQFGTVPFSILARHAFVGKSFLRSLIRLGAAAETEADAFQRSIKTVASELVVDLQQTASGSMSKQALLERYGHLRPGAYDILSLRYDQRADLISDISARAGDSEGTADFSFSAATLRNIQELCDREKLGVGAVQLVEYIRSSAVAREYAKFQFTKNLSDALEMIAEWGIQVGLSRDELSYLSIEEILDADIVAAGRTLEQHLRDRSRAAREAHEISQALRLPHVIKTEADVSIVPLLLATPNFITKKSVRGPCVFLDGQVPEIPDIAGRIVLIESADPGFDWIFSRPLLGLVTKYGGVNSHMAIRCAEFELPAAIGCGEQIFDRILRANAVEISGSEERILPVDE